MQGTIRKMFINEISLVLCIYFLKHKNPHSRSLWSVFTVIFKCIFFFYCILFFLTQKLNRAFNFFQDKVQYDYSIRYKTEIIMLY